MTDKIDNTELNIAMNRASKRGSKRKALIVENGSDNQYNTAIVEQLLIENMVLGGGRVPKSHFKRLCYFGCPQLTKKGELKANQELVNMERDEFVRSMYHLLKPNFNVTMKNHFDELTKYVRWLDECALAPINGDYFDNQLIDEYMAQHGRWVRIGQKSKSQWTAAKNMLSFVLKRLNRPNDARKLPSIIGLKKETEKTIGLDVESELRPLLKVYLRAFKGFVKCFKEDSPPLIHPIFDEHLFNQQVELQGWTVRQITDKKGSFRKAVSLGPCHAKTWFTQFSRLAAMITFAFTGQNTKPLLSLLHRDIVFCYGQLKSDTCLSCFS